MTTPGQNVECDPSQVRKIPSFHGEKSLVVIIIVNRSDMMMTTQLLPTNLGPSPTNDKWVNSSAR
jgi:hypothetical protein